MDKELIDIFTHRLLADIALMPNEIALLKTDKKEATANLFRIFHNHKATAGYLKLCEFNALMSSGENILHALRSSNDDVTDYDQKWLLSCLPQLQLWCDQLIAHEPLSPIDSSLLPTINILDNNERTSDIMQGLNLLYVDTNAQRAKAIQRPLENIFKTVHTTDSIDELKMRVVKESADIVILNLQVEGVKIGTELLELKPDIALIVALPTLRANQKTRLLLKGLTHPIPSPIKSKDLKRQLHNIVTSHFSKVYTLISHKKIYNFIQGLDPLPSSIKKITQLCDDPESSIKEIIAVVKSDPITSASILHAANSPLYGISSTSSIDKAISAFGKRLIKAIALSDLVTKVGDLELAAYDINEEQFKKTAALRLALVSNWYAHVNMRELSLLGASAILGNLGQILINQELIRGGLISHFKQYDKSELSLAEVNLLKTSSSFVTADILEFWGLDADLVDSIRYSDAPFNANSARVQALACANAVIYKMVTPYGELLSTIPKNVKNIMKKAGLDEALLEETIQRMQEN